MSQMPTGETRRVTVRHTSDHLRVTALSPNVYGDGLDYVSIEATDTGCTSTVHAVRSDLLEALDARDRGPRLRAAVEARDDARAHAAAAERKYGEAADRLARMGEHLDAMTEQRDRHRDDARAAREALTEAGSQVNDLTKANATLNEALEQCQERLNAARLENGDLRAELAAERRAHALLADAHRKVTRSADDEHAMRSLLEQVSIVIGYQGSLDGIPQAVSARVGEVIAERDEARREAERTGRDATGRDHTRWLNDVNRALVEHAHWGGSVDDAARRVRVIAQQREQYQRERNEARVVLGRIGVAVGFPGVPDDQDAMTALVAFVQSQVENLGRRASRAEDAAARAEATIDGIVSDAEQWKAEPDVVGHREVLVVSGHLREFVRFRLEDLTRLERLLKREQDKRVEAENLRAAADRGLEATRKVSDERGNALDRIASALRCEPGDEVTALHHRIQTLTDANRALSERLNDLNAATLDDVAAHMTVEVDGQVRDATVEPEAWRVVLGSDGTHDGPVVLGHAEVMPDGGWSLQCTAYAAEPFPHQGRRYATPAGLPWAEVRDRLGNLVSVALAHRESDARARAEAMAAQEAIAQRTVSEDLF